MPHEKRTLPLLHYYLLLSSLTNLVFTAVGILVFFLVSPAAKLEISTVTIIAVVLLGKSALLGYVVFGAHKWGRFNQSLGTRFIGMYLGRFFGLLLGVYAGARIADLIGAIAGGVLLYIAGRWFGPEISSLIGHLLDHNLSVPDVAEKKASRSLPAKRLLIAVYAVVFPILLVLIAVYIRATSITFEGFPTGWLPVARWVAIAFSLYALATPWLMKRRMSISQKPAPVIDMFWLGLVVSTVPVCYGFFLFTLGASIVELGIFALVSSGAALWRIKADTASQNSQLAPDQTPET
jgi:hypothetical protein